MSPALPSGRAWSWAIAIWPRSARYAELSYGTTVLRPSLPPYSVQRTSVSSTLALLWGLPEVAPVAMARVLAPEPSRTTGPTGPRVACNAPAAPTPRLPERKSRLVKDLAMTGSDQLRRYSGETRAMTSSSCALPLSAVFHSAR